jgi:multiple sugar transport system permease protein
VWHITLPQLRGILLIMLLLQLIGTFQVFTEPFIMTGGGPENRTTTVLMLIYNYAFIAGDYGKATALSLMLAAALCVLSAIYMRLTRNWSRT